MLISPEEGCAVLRNSGNASTSLSAGMRSIHSNTRKLKILNINITLLGKHLRKEACTEPGMRLVQILKQSSLKKYGKRSPRFVQDIAWEHLSSYIPSMQEHCICNNQLCQLSYVQRQRAECSKTFTCIVTSVIGTKNKEQSGIKRQQLRCLHNMCFSVYPFTMDLVVTSFVLDGGQSIWKKHTLLRHQENFRKTQKRIQPTAFILLLPLPWHKLHPEILQSENGMTLSSHRRMCVSVWHIIEICLRCWAVKTLQINDKSCVHKSSKTFQMVGGGLDRHKQDSFQVSKYLQIDVTYVMRHCQSGRSVRTISFMSRVDLMPTLSAA